jgi:DNA-directed RNA polymerase alpha subunit
MNGCPYCGNSEVIFDNQIYPNRNTYGCGYSKSMEIGTTPCKETYLVVNKKIKLHNISSLGLAARTISILFSHNITTVQELISYNADELLELRNFGMHTLNDIRNKLRQFELKLSGDYNECISSFY